MAWTLLLGFIALTLAFVWMLLVRYRIGALEDWLAANELDLALVERQAEGVPPGPIPAPAPRPAATGSRGGAGLMRYVIAGYVFVLATSSSTPVQLLWRRRRLTRAVAGSPAAVRRSRGGDRRVREPRRHGPHPVPRPRPSRSDRSPPAPKVPGDHRPPCSADLGRPRRWHRRRRTRRTPRPVAGRRHIARYVVVGVVSSAPWCSGGEGIGSALDFYLPADQAVAQKATLGDKTFNIEGVVEPGSIRRRRPGSTSSSPRDPSTWWWTTRAARPSCSSPTSR